MLGRALKMAFWATYDHLGKLILANLICVLAVLMPGLLACSILASGNTVLLLLGIALLIATLGGFLPVFAAGLAYMAKEFIDTRDGSLASLFTGLRLYWRRAVCLGLLDVAVLSCLATSAWFYSVMLRDRAPLLGFALSALALWCLAFVLLLSALAMPTLVQKNGGVLATIKLSALLVLDNPLFAIGLGFQLVALAVGSLIVAPLMFLLSGAAAMMLASSAYEQLARKYALLEVRKTGQPVSAAGVTVPGFPGGLRVVNRNGTLVIDEDKDDYLNRGFRDFLFPWKG